MYRIQEGKKGYNFVLVSFIFQQLSESVTAVQGGVIATQGYDEIVCSTYAGKTDLEQVHKVHCPSLFGFIMFKLLLFKSVIKKYIHVFIYALQRKKM